MRFNLERTRPSIAHVDDARVLARPLTTLPGPLVRSPRVGSRFKCTLEDLYEQCSDHITEKMPSSVRLGVRPKSFFDIACTRPR